MEALIERLKAFLERNLSEILGDLRDNRRYSAKEAVKMLGGLESAMEEAGIGDQFTRIRGLFAEQYQAVSREFTETTGKVALLGQFARDNINALVDVRLDMASKTISSYLGDVRGAVLDSVIAGRRVKPTDILRSAEGRTFANIKTELNSSLMAFQQVVDLEKAKKAGIERFLYIGPDDKITRPFCRELVGGIFTLAELRAMDNGQDLPVEVFRGGYNCRHRLRPISDRLAKELEGG